MLMSCKLVASAKQWGTKWRQWQQVETVERAELARVESAEENTVVQELLGELGVTCHDTATCHLSPSLQEGRRAG